MFTVGDFAQFAQVSKRLLRYYDQIGLFKPDRIDPSSGYRFYSPEQLPQLNRILALKDLGLSLDQIQQMLIDNITTDEMQGMLRLRKAEIEQQMRAELQRMRKIEARLQSLKDNEANKPVNVILKEIPDQTVMSLRCMTDDFEMAVDVLERIHDSVPKRLREGYFYCICRSETHVETDLDMEFGIIVDKVKKDTLILPDDMVLTRRELAGSNMMATTVVQGGLDTIHRGYADILKWIGIHSYQLAGEPREVVLQRAQTPEGSDVVTEIQFPVAPIPDLHAIRY